MDTEITGRIASLRAFMKERGLSAFIIPSTDPHSGEYVPAHWEARKWISGFTGSAGTAVITLNKGGLWTDSRYFLQAEAQLKDTGIVLFKDRLEETPSIAEWLGSELKPQDKVGIDGWVNAYSEAESLRNALATYGIELTVSEDPFQWIWKDRPALPLNTPFILPLAYAGVSASEKLDIIRNQLSKSQADGILISALDEIAWTLNLRGDDIHCNPVFISYLLITQENATLYIIKEKLTPELTAYLDDNKIGTCDYTQIENDLRHFPGKRIQLSSETNLTLYLAATQSGASIVMNHPSPVCLLKAIKNGTEIEGFRQAMKRDGVAMVRFLMWLEQAVPNGQETEISIDQKLYELRAQQALFHGISFDTIAGYQEHGAIVHYEATPQTAYTLKPEGLLLLDSGAQYTDGTTDITRTIALGPVSEAQRIDYTLVLKGFIALSQAEFPQGTCGTQLDVLARQYMWKAGINYGHGTGHGVGHFLNVHEGPHQVRMNHMPALLQPGMTLTNEPGIYKAGRYGVRTENTMLIIESQTTEFGKFYKFEPLTLCPIDKTPIYTEMLTPGEKQWLNEYHAYVYAQLSPLLNEEEKAWLAKATSEI
ncbi:aminopeptidase P family protein [Bacteroides gallinaceum]|uniref:aminopeptidase P family protein n=1 Tax=Bacteroides gallinaceum TaxID=1462571 RepID=UPI0025A35149|nr:aminopeptidase P family protein [Bacteroides gallinaceum]MDM8155197.1 aminopeptidase P family protein [Bacteroides gallinaceum]